eukprot:scaffold1934_cov444-Prasinococcus_capsulatus_cf.AAC.2
MNLCESQSVAILRVSDSRPLFAGPVATHVAPNAGTWAMESSQTRDPALLARNGCRARCAAHKHMLVILPQPFPVGRDQNLQAIKKALALECGANQYTLTQNLSKRFSKSPTPGFRGPPQFAHVRLQCAQVWSHAHLLGPLGHKVPDAFVGKAEYAESCPLLNFLQLQAVSARARSVELCGSHCAGAAALVIQHRGIQDSYRAASTWHKLGVQDACQHMRGHKSQYPIAFRSGNTTRPQTDVPCTNLDPAQGHRSALANGSVTLSCPLRGRRHSHERPALPSTGCQYCRTPSKCDSHSRSTEWPSSVFLHRNTPAFACRTPSSDL